MIGLTLFILQQFFTTGFAQSGSLQSWALQIRNGAPPGEIIAKEIGNKRPSNILIPANFLPPQTQQVPTQPAPTPAPAPSNPNQQGPQPSTPEPTPKPPTQPVPQPSTPKPTPRPPAQPVPQPSTPEPTPRPPTQPVPQPSTPEPTPRPPTQPVPQPSTPITPATTPASNEALLPSQRPSASEPISTAPTQPAPQTSTPTTPATNEALLPSQRPSTSEPTSTAAPQPTPTPPPDTTPTQNEALLHSQRPGTSEPIFTTPTQPSTLYPTPNEAVLSFQRPVTSERIFTAPQPTNAPQSFFLPSLNTAVPNAPSVIQQQVIAGRGPQPQPQPIVKNNPVVVSKNPQQVSIVKQAPAPVVPKKGQNGISVFIVPDKCTKLEDLLQNTKELSILAGALEAAKLDTSNAKENTVFAPTNKAFQQLAKQLNTNLQELLQDSKLSSILLYHFVPGKLLQLGDLNNGQKLSTGLKEQSLEVEKKSGENVVNIKGFQSTAKVTKGNVKACDTIIHIIDTVLLPKL